MTDEAFQNHANAQFVELWERIRKLEDELKARLRLDEHLSASLRHSEQSRTASAGQVAELEQALARNNEIMVCWRRILGVPTNEEATKKLEALMRADRLFEYMANAAEVLNMRLNDAMRSLENDDKHGAMACLRDAVTEKAENILPCAHCGCPGLLYKDGDGGCWGWAVKCPECGAHTTVDLRDKSKGVRAWNQRKAAGV